MTNSTRHNHLGVGVMGTFANKKIRDPRSFTLAFLDAALLGNLAQFGAPFKKACNRRGKYLHVKDENPVVGSFLIPVKEAESFLVERLAPYACLPRKAALWAASEKLRVKEVPEGAEVMIEEGRSYFGSGGYFGSFRTNVPTDRWSEERWDNGCAAGRRVVVALRPGEWAGSSGGDGVGGYRTLANTLFVCA